jgi:hypothetical protein
MANSVAENVEKQRGLDLFASHSKTCHSFASGARRRSKGTFVAVDGKTSELVVHLSETESHEEVKLRENANDAVIDENRNGSLRDPPLDVKSPNEHAKCGPKRGESASLREAVERENGLRHITVNDQASRHDRVEFDHEFDERGRETDDGSKLRENLPGHRVEELADVDSKTRLLTSKAELTLFKTESDIQRSISSLNARAAASNLGRAHLKERAAKPAKHDGGPAAIDEGKNSDRAKVLHLSVTDLVRFRNEVTSRGREGNRPLGVRGKKKFIPKISNEIANTEREDLELGGSAAVSARSSESLKLTEATPKVFTREGGHVKDGTRDGINLRFETRVKRIPISLRLLPEDRRPNFHSFLQNRGGISSDGAVGANNRARRGARRADAAPTGASRPSVIRQEGLLDVLDAVAATILTARSEKDVKLAQENVRHGERGR